MKELLRLACAILVVCFAPSAGSQEVAPESPRTPVLDQTAMIDRAVDIYYDEWMIPHIFGENDEAAMYGLGYHHMLEFPIGTLNMLWMSSGRMSEIAGSSYLDEDHLIRLWMKSSTPSITDRHRTELIDSGLYDMILAYVEGIEAGREWWRTGTRLEQLIGDDDPGEPTEHLEMWVDPVPDYLNPAWSPYGNSEEVGHPDPVTDAIRNVVDRMFDATMVVTPDHVLNLGAAINSFTLLRNNTFGFNAVTGSASSAPLAPRSTPLSSLASNGWMISPDAATAGGDALTLADGHVGFNKLVIRPYIVQVHSDEAYSATGLTMPGYPAVYVGFNDNISWLVTNVSGGTVSRNKWVSKIRQIQLVGGGFGLGIGTTALVGEPESYVVYDPLADTVSAESRNRYYVPVAPGDPDDGLGFSRYPIAKDVDVKVGETVVFEQSAFTTESSPWEFFLLMGKATNATTDIDAILDTSSPTTRTRRVLFGNGMNLMVADSDGHFRYQFMSRVPVQGPAVPPSLYREGQKLPGKNKKFRWTGFHPNVGASPISVPSMTAGPDVVSALGSEVWINNNVTPDLVELGANDVYDAEDRFSADDLADRPAYLVGKRALSGEAINETIATWRQVRADELLRSPSGILDQAASEAVACDQTDNWMRSMWPLFQVVRGDHDHDGSLDSAPLGTLTPLDQSFVDWIEAHRHLDECDAFDATYDFVAHAFSEVTIYTTFMRSVYFGVLQDYIDDELLDEDQFTLGQDPLHAVFASPVTLLTPTDYAPNIEALATAITRGRRLWVRGTSAIGLQNQDELELLFPTGLTKLPGLEWEDVRFATGLRWGHVNSFAVTPHTILPVPRLRFMDIAKGFKEPPFSVTGLGASDVSEIYIRMALDPLALDPGATTLSGPAVSRFLVPFYYAQPRFARPIGGVKNSLFTIENKKLFGGTTPPNGYEQAVYVWDEFPANFYYYVPMSAGSQSMLSVSIGAGGASGRFLLGLGGTEITVPDVVSTSDPGVLSYQGRYKPSQAFVDCTFNDIELDPSMLGTPMGTPKWDLIYSDPTP